MRPIHLALALAFWAIVCCSGSCVGAPNGFANRAQVAADNNWRATRRPANESAQARSGLLWDATGCPGPITSEFPAQPDLKFLKNLNDALRRVYPCPICELKVISFRIQCMQKYWYRILLKVKVRAGSGEDVAFVDSAYKVGPSEEYRVYTLANGKRENDSLPEYFENNIVSCPGGCPPARHSTPRGASVAGVAAALAA